MLMAVDSATAGTTTNNDSNNIVGIKSFGIPTRSGSLSAPRKGTTTASIIIITTIATSTAPNMTTVDDDGLMRNNNNNSAVQFDESTANASSSSGVWAFGYDWYTSKKMT